MKKTLAVLALTALVALGGTAVATAHGWGGGGYGHGPYMMSYGYGPGGDAKYLDETADVRRDLNTKQFEYEEALRDGDEKKARELAGEMDALTAKLGEKAPWGRNYARGGAYCPGPYGW